MIANKLGMLWIIFLILSGCQYFPYERDDPWWNKLGSIIGEREGFSLKKNNFIDENGSYPWKYGLQNRIYRVINDALQTENINERIDNLKNIGMYCGKFNNPKIECRYKVPFLDDKSWEEKYLHDRRSVYLLYISVYPADGIESLRFYRTYPIRTEKFWKNEVLNDMKTGELL